jgi:hypothetical protein
MKLTKIAAAAGLVFALGLPQAASAALSCPTPGVGAAESLGGQYCTDNYGASNAWYAPPVVLNDLSRDLLSGDDAVFLSWAGLAASATTTFLTPKLDAGKLQSSYDTGSNWTVTSALSGAGTPTTTSSIILDLGGGSSVGVVITTTIDNRAGVHQTYTVTNNSTAALNNLVFGDLFNYHPYGSSPTGYTLGTTEYADGKIVAHGTPGDPSLLRNGVMSLGVNGAGVMPTAWDVVAYGPLANPVPAAAAISEVNCLLSGLPGDCLSNASGPTTGDAAGILAYNYGSLGIGASVTFDLFKTPEPASLALLGVAGLAGAFARRRQV